jgi:hypothetical protein
VKKSFITSIFLIAVNFCPVDAFAQCSDAGICQLGEHQGEEKGSYMYNISASYKYGYSGKDDDIQFHSLVLNGNFNITDYSSAQFLFPYNIQSGPAGSISGIGDMIISWNQQLFSDENSSFNASLGIKLATGEDNKDSLPQLYQSGLGKNDVLIGINYLYDNLNIGAGYQISGGRNDNLYRLKKGNDLLLRVSYELTFDLVSITPKLLYIQPMSRSSILSSSTNGGESFIEIDKSDKAQINLLTELRYKILYNISLQGDFAIPFIKREVNLDGLTRAYSASLGLGYSFN